MVYYSRHSPEFRDGILAAFRSGLSFNEVARAYHRAPDTVWYWWRKYCGGTCVAVTARGARCKNHVSYAPWGVAVCRAHASPPIAQRLRRALELLDDDE